MSENQSEQIYYYSAPGKAIISGEHSVVYYKNALVMALDLRTYCKITVSNKSENNNNSLIIENKQESDQSMKLGENDLKKILNYVSSLKLDEEFSVLQQQFPEINEKLLIISYLFLTVFRKLNNPNITPEELIQSFSEKIIKTKLIYVQIHSTLPISKGLGSSASYFTSLSASFTHMCQNILNITQIPNGIDKFINNLAFNFERIYHGNPSGIDNHIATYGSFLVYNKNLQLTLRVNELPYEIILIDSQVEKSTKKAVARVKEIYDDESLDDIGKKSIDMISQITEKIIEIFNPFAPSFDCNKFENLIRMNQSLLRLFDLSHSAIEDIMSVCMKYDIAAKITGAGQGGNCIAFVPLHINEAKKRDFLEELQNHGYSVISAHLSKEGFRQEQH